MNVEAHSAHCRMASSNGVTIIGGNTVENVFARGGIGHTNRVNIFVGLASNITCHVIK